MYWPWQTVLALVLLIAITIVAVVTGSLWFSKRKQTFFACRTPLYAGLCASYNYIVCAAILFQIIVEYSVLEEERVTGQPSDAHFPCDIMLAVSTLNYTLFAIPSTLMSTTLIVKFYTKYRATRWRHVLRRKIVYSMIAAGFTFTVVVFLILKFSLNEYRANSSGLQCSYAQEWYVYWPMSFVLFFGTVGLTDAIKSANDLYLVGRQMRAGMRAIGLFSQTYMVMQCILGSLTWAGAIDRTAMEARGLPFDTLALCQHTFFFWNVIIRPLLWHGKFRQQYELSETSKRTSGTRSSYQPSNLVSETRRASDRLWLSDLSDDDEQGFDGVDDQHMQQSEALINTAASDTLGADIASSNRASALQRSSAAPLTPLLRDLKYSLSIDRFSYSNQQPIARHSLASIHVKEQQQSPTKVPASAGPLFLRLPSTTQTSDIKHNAVAPLTATLQQSKRQGALFQLASTNTKLYNTTQTDLTITSSKRPAKWTCLRVLSDPDMFTAFEQHAQRTLNGENTEFWKECEAYRTLWCAHRQQRRVTKQHLPASDTVSAATVQLDHATIDIVNPLDLPVDKTAFCRYMYGKYVKSNAAFELNISDALRKRYKDAMDGKLPLVTGDAQTSSPVSVDKQREQLLFALLSEVQRECYKLLDTNVWRTFRTSDEFKKLGGDDQDVASETHIIA